MHVIRRQGAHLIIMSRKRAQRAKPAAASNELRPSSLSAKAASVSSVALADGLLLLPTLPIKLLTTIISNIIICSHVKLINPSINKRRRRQRANFVNITINAHDIWWHHKLHIKTSLTKCAVALLPSEMIALGSIKVSASGLLMLRNKYLLRKHLSFVLVDAELIWILHILMIPGSPICCLLLVYSVVLLDVVEALLLHLLFLGNLRPLIMYQMTLMRQLFLMMVRLGAVFVGGIYVDFRQIILKQRFPGCSVVHVPLHLLQTIRRALIIHQI